MEALYLTLTTLLASKSQERTVGVSFLDGRGDITNELSYADLYKGAVEDCQRLRLLLSQVKPGSNVDVVVASFSSHEHHIKLFWACLFAGIPMCPIPPLHPDPTRQAAFFNHLETLFDHPVMITDDLNTIERLKTMAPSLQTVPWATFTAQTLSPEPLAIIDVTPDTVACFMLTSGSTGNSKAVALRHSNLLSSVYGKIKLHGTTSQSRFLNWIAFDHVACVSEVHIHALAANAGQYHVSPSNIVQRPLNLLEWCGRYGITYSFSPNFLIAQLCRELSASPLPTRSIDLSGLAAFISGGEAVPIKTAIEFANILESMGAPRNVLRAGFGMSETGAGCIYNIRPVPRSESAVEEKYLSLGICCDGTDVRVVSRETGEPCGANQPGLLQLKGPTVFRGYHNNPQANAASFTSDGWFTTGDGALLDKDGNLHLVGREKDQLNINGVKYPTVDAEHFVEEAAIEGVTRSTVFVCPMRAPGGDTETYAVFYLHQTIAVEGELSDEDVATIARTNRSIRDRCIVFCSQGPHTILPLPRKNFARTALGKVSRAQLLAAYLGGQFTALEERLRKPLPGDDKPLTEHEKKVAQIIANLLGVDPSCFYRSTSLFDMGMSSMHLVQLKYHFQDKLGITDIPIIDMLRHPEFGQLADYLAESLGSEGPNGAVKKYNPLVCLNPRGSKPPVFLVHPGVGEVLVFMGLAHALADDRPIYAIRARGFDSSEKPFVSFDEMTEVYVDAIEQQFPQGPYYVGGYSFGGAVAFEMGKLLESRGRKVAWVGIFNLPPFIQNRMHELNWVEVLLNLFMFVALIVPSKLDSTRKQLRATFTELETLDTEPSNSMEVIAWLLERSDQVRLEELQLRPLELRNWVRVAYELTCLGRTYLPSGAIRDALVTIFCAVPLPSMGTRESYKAHRLSPWRDFVEGDFELVDVDGEHYTMLSDEHVQSFARNLRGSLARAAARALPPPRKLQSDFDAVPVIDFSLAQTQPKRYYAQLRTALEDVGFVVFTNVPGFEASFQKELFAIAERLFSKPKSWKDALDCTTSHALRGFFNPSDLPVPHKAHAEAYRFGPDLPEPAGDNVPFWLKLHQGPNLWPNEEDLPHFRELMETLFARCHALSLRLNQHVCRILDINQELLDAYYPEETEFNGAIWRYLPATPEIRASIESGSMQWLHGHPDPNTFLTCQIQSSAGLQVQNRAGAWIDVPMIEGGVVCNTGMQLMKLTSGKLVAATHRVNPLAIEKDRYAFPYVLCTKVDKAVVPLPQFVHHQAVQEKAAPNPMMLKLMSIADPSARRGFARLTLFPEAARKLYPDEFRRAQELGLM